MATAPSWPQRLPWRRPIAKHDGKPFLGIDLVGGGAERRLMDLKGQFRIKLLSRVGEPRAQPAHRRIDEKGSQQRPQDRFTLRLSTRSRLWAFPSECPFPPRLTLVPTSQLGASSKYG